MLDIRPASEPLPKKVWNAHVDALIETGQLNPEILEFMSSDQQWVINEIKKSLTRIKKKYARQVNENSK